MTKITIPNESLIMELVRQMHQKFDIDYDGPPRRLSNPERQFRIDCLTEELSEFINSQSLKDDYDALIDLIVFAVGTLERMGLPLLPAYQIVMSCNMSKVKGPNAKRGGFTNDLQKPKDFLGPDGGLMRIINELERAHAGK